MKYGEVLYDIETDGLDYTKIHCICVRPYLRLVGGTTVTFTDVPDFDWWAREYTNEDTIWTAHNACGFDYHVINDLTNTRITRAQVLDTSVISKLKNYNRYSTHSLKELGEDLGVYKGEYEGDWEHLTQEMIDYCKQDVEVLAAIRKSQHNFISNPDYWAAIVVERETALILHEMQKNGFTFDEDKATKLLEEVTREMSLLEAGMQAEWPPELVEDRRIQWRMTKAGVPHAACVKAQAAAPKWLIDGDELVLYKYKEFNPGSPKDRVDKLWDAGWKPYDKTKGHYQHERDRKNRWR